VKPGEDLFRIVYNSLTEEQLQLQHADILAIASKIVSVCEGRIVKLADAPVNRTARLAARKWRVDEKLAAFVVKEADEIVGGVNGFILTVKNGILTPNAGIDMKNSPRGTATLWPINPDRSARELRRKLARRCNTSIGVEIVDSHVTPLRLGTVGLAIGLSGFVPVRDHRGVHDIFGRSIRVTQANVADDLAAAAHLLMGESKEHVGAVLIRGGELAINAAATGELARLNRDRCLIGSSLRSGRFRVKGHA